MRPEVIRGRGAISNREGRFESLRLEAYDDGWNHLENEPQTRPKTTITRDNTRAIVTHNQSPDIPFDASINPYRGCEHGCIYCYARQSHAYLGLSAGLDFETRLFSKPDAAQLLEKEFSRRSYVPKPIAIGSNTDAYQPIERELKITRSLLEVFLAWRHPVAIITKSALIMRDMDLLAQLADLRLVAVAVSVTTLDPKLARIMEPRGASPKRRIQTIEALAREGIPVGVNVAPLIPALNDPELEKILETAAAAGASSAAYILLRLPFEVRDLFVEWLETHFPDRADHVMNLLRQMRDGLDYQARFGERMRGTGVYADLISQRFRITSKRLGLERRDFNLDCSQFRKPPRAGDQLSLFEENR